MQPSKEECNYYTITTTIIINNNNKHITLISLKMINKKTPILTMMITSLSRFPASKLEEQLGEIWRE